MVVHRNRENFFRLLLANHVLIEDVIDFFRNRKFAAHAGRGFLLDLLANDVVTKFDTFVAYEYGGSRDQLAYFVLTFPAKGTVQKPVAVAAF